MLDHNSTVLLLLGEKDNTGKVRAYNRQWSERTGSKWKMIRDIGHNSNVDQPDKVNYEIEEFINSLEVKKNKI